MYTAFSLGWGSEAQPWLGKTSGAVLLGGEVGVLQQGRGRAARLATQTHGKGAAGWGPGEARPRTVVIAGTSLGLVWL